MAESGGDESGKPGKRQAKSEGLDGEPSSSQREGGEEFRLEAAEDAEAEDPLLVFGSEIMTIIMGKMDMRSVAEARLVSRGWQAVASSDRIWGPKDFFLIFRSSPKSLLCFYDLRKSTILEIGYCQPWGTDCQCELEKRCARSYGWVRHIYRGYQWLKDFLRLWLPYSQSEMENELESLGMTFVTMNGNSALQSQRQSTGGTWTPTGAATAAPRCGGTSTRTAASRRTPTTRFGAAMSPPTPSSPAC